MPKLTRVLTKLVLLTICAIVVQCRSIASAQTNRGELRVVNESEEAICSTLVGLRDESIVGANQISIAGGSSYLYLLDPGDYQITVDDCSIKVWLEQIFDIEASDSLAVSHTSPKSEIRSEEANQLYLESVRLFSSGEYSNAISKAELALHLRQQEVPNDYREARLHDLLADAFSATGRHEAALRHAIEALSLFNRVGEQRWAGYAMLTISAEYEFLELYGLALDYANEAYQLMLEWGTERSLGSAQ